MTRLASATPIGDVVCERKTIYQMPPKEKKEAAAPVDPGQFHGQGIRESGVAARVPQQDRVLGGDL